MIWGYPERQLEASSRLDNEQSKELARWMFSLGAPRRVMSVGRDPEKEIPSLTFGRPERAMLKLRMKHVMGQWPDAIQGYLAAQLYDVDPPTSKDLPTVNANEKRVLRGMIPREIRELHTRAGDDACYWIILCQLEQNRAKATIEQCVSYLDRHSSGAWANAARSLLASSLAKQKRYKEALRILKEIDEDSPSLPGDKVLAARWQRLMEAGE